MVRRIVQHGLTGSNLIETDRVNFKSVNWHAQHGGLGIVSTIFCAAFVLARIARATPYAVLNERMTSN